MLWHAGVPDLQETPSRHRYSQKLLPPTLDADADDPLDTPVAAAGFTALLLCAGELIVLRGVLESSWALFAVTDACPNVDSASHKANEKLLTKLST